MTVGDTYYKLSLNYFSRYRSRGNKSRISNTIGLKINSLAEDLNCTSNYGGELRLAGYYRD